MAAIADEHRKALADEALEQRREALLSANRIRAERAELKRAIKAGEKHATDVIADPPKYALSMKIQDVLWTVPKLGDRRVNEFMVALKIPPTETLATLPNRTRTKLVARLVEHARRPSQPAARSDFQVPGFGGRLRSARLAKGLCQREVTAAIHYSSHVSLSHWENGYRVPAPSVIRKLAEVLEVDAAWLGGWSR